GEVYLSDLHISKFTEAFNTFSSVLVIAIDNNDKTLVEKALVKLVQNFKDNKDYAEKLEERKKQFKNYIIHKVTDLKILYEHLTSKKFKIADQSYDIPKDELEVIYKRIFPLSEEQNRPSLYLYLARTFKEIQDYDKLLECLTAWNNRKIDVARF